SPTPPVPYRTSATMQRLAPNPATTPPPPTSKLANPPIAPLLAQGGGSDLTVTWTAPPVDSAHDAATGFNLRFSLSGAGVWMTVAGVTSPYALADLTAGAAYDVELQSANAAGTSLWSPASTHTTATTGVYA